MRRGGGRRRRRTRSRRRGDERGASRARAVVEALDADKDRLLPSTRAPKRSRRQRDARLRGGSGGGGGARGGGSGGARGGGAADACAAVERKLHLAEGKLAQARRVEEEMRAEAAARRRSSRRRRGPRRDDPRTAGGQRRAPPHLQRARSARGGAPRGARGGGARADAAEDRAARKEVDDVVGAYQELASAEAENRTDSRGGDGAGTRLRGRARLALDAGEAALAQAHARIRTVEGENKQYVVDLQAFERQADGLARALAEAERAGEGGDARVDGAARSTRRGAGAQRRTRTRAQSASQRELAAAEATLRP